MDRTNNKKIKSYVFVWLLILLVITTAMAGFSVYREVVERNQMMELIQNYPELESEIIDIFESEQEVQFFEENNEIHIIEEKYGYALYKSAFSVEKLLLWGIIIFSVGIGVGFLIRQGKKQKIYNDKILDLLYEELQSFQKGDYEGTIGKIPDLESWDLSEKWESILESLKELGYYFEDMGIKLSEEENRTKTLITDIAHQLKTPLASLRMCHELTMSEALTNEERKEFQEQEKLEIEKLELLLDELVKLSRLENHMVQIQTEYQDIKQTVSEAVSQVYGKAKGKQIEIQADIENDISVLHDRKWTVEAISNVLDNAIKYSERQTTIQIRVQLLPSNLLIEIDDQGMGIPADDLHKIFKRFYRGAEASKKVKDGVGVGLYLSRKIIELQGGTITAKRRQEKGTTFRITLPL